VPSSENLQIKTGTQEIKNITVLFIAKIHNLFKSISESTSRSLFNIFGGERCVKSVE